jgi:hypothetical protein
VAATPKARVVCDSLNSGIVGSSPNEDLTIG